MGVMGFQKSLHDPAKLTGTQPPRFMIDRHDAAHVEEQVLILAHQFILRAFHLDPVHVARVCRDLTAQHDAQSAFEHAFKVRLIEKHHVHGTRVVTNRHGQQGHGPPPRPLEPGLVDGTRNGSFFTGDQFADGHDVGSVFVPPG